MKKMLSLLSAAVIAVSGTAAVVACNGGSKVNDVIFMIDGSTTTSSSIINAYKDVVDDFNANYNKSGIKIVVETPAAGQILNSIMAGENLPDLYLTYPDNVARYKSLIPDEVVNVEDEGYVPDAETFVSDQDSFLEEGTIGDDLYVLPVLKSFDVNTVNLRLLKEMTDFFKTESTTYAANGVFMKNELGLQEDGKDISIESADLFDESQDFTTTNSGFYDEIAKSESAAALRKLLQKDDNITQLATDFKGLTTKNKSNTESTKDYAKAYAIGIDSIENKIYANYANNMNTSRIEVSKENKDFLYNYYNNEFHVNNTTGATGTKEFIDWLEELRKLEGADSSLNSDSSKLDETGALFVANSDGSKKVYSSDYFSQGSMLMASGSTAGSFYYSTAASDVESGEVKEDVAVGVTDLFVVPTSTSKGDAYIMQQGPGVGAFKSTTTEKADLAKEFTKFLMNKDNMAQMAIWSGYMPANEMSYSGTDYNEWIKGTKKVLSAKNQKEYDRTNLIIAQVSELLKDKENNHFTTIESSEPGNGIRDKVFKNTIQAGMYKSAGELTMDKFWNGEKLSTITYTGAKAQFDSIATDLDPNLKPTYETAIKTKAAIISRREE